MAPNLKPLDSPEPFSAFLVSSFHDSSFCLVFPGSHVCLNSILWLREELPGHATRNSLFLVWGTLKSSALIIRHEMSLYPHMDSPSSKELNAVPLAWVSIPGTFSKMTYLGLYLFIIPR